MLLNRINEGFIRKYQVDEAIKNSKKNRKKIVESVERPEKFADYDDDMNCANYGAEEGFFETDDVNESLTESADISEYQKWVDYDMKKYGKISKLTMSKIKNAGFSVVKDQYGDYEVIADRKDESLKESVKII